MSKPFRAPVVRRKVRLRPNSSRRTASVVLYQTRRKKLNELHQSFILRPIDHEDVDSSDRRRDIDQFQDSLSGEDEVPQNLTMSTEQGRSPVPGLFTSLPPVRDSLSTESSILQDLTVEECLPFLDGTEHLDQSPLNFNSYGVPRLQRERHISYFHDCMKKLPSKFVAYDASRPWIVYWALTGLSMLGEDVSSYEERYLARCLPL